MIIQYLTAFIHFISLFYVIWFFISHIWVFGHLSDCGYRAIHGFSITIVYIQYILGAWFIFCYIWNRPYVLRWCANKIRNRLDRIPVENQTPVPVQKETSEPADVANLFQNQLFLNV